MSLRSAAKHVQRTLRNWRNDRRFAHDQHVRRIRVEHFGAIVHTLAPRALVFVDRAYAKRTLGLNPSKPWQDASLDGEITARPLFAPLEAHLQITNVCDAGCKGCYTGASPQPNPRDWQLEQWKSAVDELAKAGVFHVALGGGESAVLPWLGDLARYAWSKGIVPNLTTSGLQNLDELVAIADCFGQINVSLDGLGAAYQRVRGFDGFAQADHAIERLRAVKREVGINVVVTRENFAQLEDLFEYAKNRRLSEVELLRFKPSGRGAKTYDELRCTDAQHRLFFPLIRKYALRNRVRAKVDCSYTPMLAFHDPGRDVLAQLAVFGCTGGDFLIGVKPQGQLTACSFASALGTQRPTVTELGDYWNSPDAFGVFRQWKQARQPCSSCEYLSVCRGGCRVVSAHAGDIAAPDPECPRVIARQKREAISDAVRRPRRLPVI